MVFFVMERKKTDVLLQPWASSRPRLAGASQVVFIMRQSRIQILGCGCSPHLADWMQRCATSRRWEVKVQKIHCNVSFWNSIFAPVSTPAKSLTCLCFEGRVNLMRSGAPWTPRVIAVSATSRRCCATSVCIHQWYTPELLILQWVCRCRAVSSTGILLTCTAQLVLRVCVSDTFTALQCYALVYVAHPSSWDPRSVWSWLVSTYL